MIRAVKAAAGVILYELTQTKRRTMEVRVSANGSVRLYAPKQVALKDADAFILKKAEWIEDVRAEFRRQGAVALQDRPMETGAKILYEGILTPLLVVPGAQKRIDFDGERIEIRASDVGSEAVRVQLRAWLWERALEQTTRRAEYYGRLIGGDYRKVAVRDQRTRWGSCSSQRNLSFNWKLIMAPPEVLDYVVVHELCHLHEFDHSPKFWARVERHLPDYRTWKDWLKANGHILGV